MFNLSKKDGKIVDLYITEKSVRVIVDKRDTYYVMQCGMMDETTLQFDTELDLSALITRISDTKHSAQVNAVTKQESSTTQLLHVYLVVSHVLLEDKEVMILVDNHFHY